MQCLYRWVDCLNVELAHTRRMPTIAPPQNDTTLYDSDEEVFFECMNRADMRGINKYITYPLHQSTHPSSEVDSLIC